MPLWGGAAGASWSRQALVERIRSRAAPAPPIRSRATLSVKPKARRVTTRRRAPSAYVPFQWPRRLQGRSRTLLASVNMDGDQVPARREPASILRAGAHLQASSVRVKRSAAAAPPGTDQRLIDLDDADRCICPATSTSKRLRAARDDVQRIFMPRECLRDPASVFRARSAFPRPAKRSPRPVTCAT